VWLLTPHFGLSEVGQLSLAMMAAFVPLSIISRACYQVLYQRVAELVQNRRSVSRVLWRFCLWIARALVVGLIPVFVFVPQLVTFIFGAEWLESAYIIRALYPFIVLTPICGSICFLSDVFAKQKTALWMEVGYVAALALALVAGIHTGDYLSAIALFAWVRFAYLAIQLVWYIFLVRNYNRTLS
jgi:O-antigen/teichoic acid export membrane protein